MKRDNAAKNVNRGHRGRLRKKYINGGAEILEFHELLELILYSTIPVVDVNKTAHEIINHCGGLDEVFKASKKTLMSVSGVGEKTADFIVLFGEMMRRYEYSKQNEEGLVFEKESGMRYVISLFENRFDCERLYMICLGSENKVITADLLAEGKINYSKLSIKEIVRTIININAFRVIFAHNHTDEKIMPSNEAIKFTKEISKALDFIDVEMTDHVIITKTGGASMRNDLRVI